MMIVPSKIKPLKTTILDWLKCVLKIKYVKKSCQQTNITYDRLCWLGEIELVDYIRHPNSLIPIPA